MNSYTLGIEELDNAIGGIRKSSNIMLIGPPMSRKEAILYHVMYHGAARNENAIIIVTTQESATHILEGFKENKLTQILSRIGIVDCISKKVDGVASNNENVKFASSPTDLTGMGVRISQFFEEFLIKKNCPGIQLYINSLSTILMYSNIQTVYKFLHVFTGRIKAAGGLGIYLITSGMHEVQTIAILQHLCDGIIEIISENDKNFIRVAGFSLKSTSYFEYEVEGSNVKIVGRK